MWHDEDELLKFSQYGYFEEFHERISAVTDIPSEVIVESEPLQVRHYEKGQFQVYKQLFLSHELRISFCYHFTRFFNLLPVQPSQIFIP